MCLIDKKTGIVKPYPWLLRIKASYPGIETRSCPGVIISTTHVMVPSWCCIGRVRLLFYQGPSSVGCVPRQYQYHDYFLELMFIDDPNDDDRTWMSGDLCIINTSHSKRFSKRLQPICVSKDNLKKGYFGEKSDSNRTYALFTWRDGEDGEPFLWQQKVIPRNNDGSLAFKFTRKTIEASKNIKGVYVYAMAFVQDGKWFLEAIQSKPFSSFFRLTDILNDQKLPTDICSGQ
ncbi:uncharacterized protein LOC141849247 [Brevipalpus obovatus]|uniref:uncharacterized protein LOC141849247 n=1 Tax=Brevipalpus obovatus TaxID=246614 RepID=UPI003D9E42E1